MDTEEITVRVTPGAARIYSSATAEEKAKLNLLISLRIGEAGESRKSLEEILQEVRSQAETNGLTTESLQGILSE